MGYLLDAAFSATMYLLDSPVLGALALLLTVVVGTAIINDLVKTRLD